MIDNMTQHPWLHVLQWVLLFFFMIPLLELVMMAFGALWAQIGYAKAPVGTFTKLIIQVTTVGKEHKLVQRTIDKIRSYGLTMDYEIWVAIEPGFHTDYTDVDKVIVVPADFVCPPIHKARALAYAQRIRAMLGLNRKDVKLLLVDDDTLPSERYINMAFNGDYDICQGITVPNRWFGTGGFKRFLLCHLDNIRTRNCLIYCSCTQGVTQKPLFVHGEGLCMTGWVEQAVSWDRPIVASDDLVFGTNATHEGLSFGYFHAAIQLVSPHSWRENLNQRWRWTWGNFDAILNREIMPLGAAIFKGFKYVLGFISVPASLTGSILLLNGVAKVPPQAHMVFWISMGAWFFGYGLSGWINSGGEPNRERLGTGLKFWSNRVFQTLAATVLTPLTAMTPIVVITYSVCRGRPKNENGEDEFVMVEKLNENVMKLDGVAG